MLDEEWLDLALRYELADGTRFEGLAGVGGSNLVVRVSGADGKGHAYRHPKRGFYFPSYIREIPNWFASRPRYDVGVLNDKLSGLLGDPMVAALVEPYERVFAGFAHNLRDFGFGTPGVVQLKGSTPDSD